MNKKVKCFFCDKELTKEEIAALKRCYFSVCFECKSWFSQGKKKKTWKILLIVFALCNKLPSTLGKTATIVKQLIEESLYD